MEELLLKTKKTVQSLTKKNQRLSLKKVAVGSTFDIFQWKKPNKVANEYEVSINGKKIRKKSEASLVLFSCYKSDFNEGENTFSVKVLNDHSERIMDEVKFNYSFVD
ncbi:hypothetical protein [Aquimarina agarilytica]|uniref:hypothetical protein n=1 Tax=Aquimarina agarilytica TaxID=1087449 RepID=UPI00028810E9|nr:hypothetical protein [Aquimarina agarilytica]